MPVQGASFQHRKLSIGKAFSIKRMIKNGREKMSVEGQVSITKEKKRGVMNVYIKDEEGPLLMERGI